MLTAGAFVLLLGACASPRGGGGGPAATEAPAEAPDPEAAARAEAAGFLERLDSLRTADPGRAARVADSAYFRWRGREGLAELTLRALAAEARALTAAGDRVEAAARWSELLEGEPPAGLAREAAGRLAALRIELGQEPDAVRILTARGPTPPAPDRRELLREAASGLSASELERALGRLEAADTGDRELLRVERERVRRLRAERGAAVPRVEVVLPLSGSLEMVGSFLRQGMEVALDAHRSADGDSVAVIFRDDGSEEERARALVRRAEREGAVAVVGPARSGALAAALGERGDPALLLLSPTATRAPEEGWNAFTLWERAYRERELAGALAAWLIAEAGLAEVAVLRPRGPAGLASEQAFRAGVERAGGGVVGAAAYVSDSTTFEAEIALLAGQAPAAVYVASRDPRTSLQIAPQLSYYGLSAAAVAGGGGWSEPAVVRRLRDGSPSLYATAVFTDRGPTTAWSEFKAMYEKKYDRPLSDNILPALGYDAMKAVLEAAGSVGLPRRGAVARAASSAPVDGATGRFRLAPGRMSARREAGVRLATGGELQPADPGRLREWVAQARQRQGVQDRRRRERAAERVRQWVERQEREEGSGGRP